MEMTLLPGKLSGVVTAPSSKSMVHRLLITAAFAGSPTQIGCDGMGADLLATMECLQALGADIRVEGKTISVTPTCQISKTAALFCGESGSTLRFLLPIVGALGVEATFHTKGRLPQRPLSPLWEEMERMGCLLSRPTEDTLLCSGKLRPGAYYIDGSVSSQFVSGLLMALPLIDGECSLEINGTMQSKPYVEMTRQVLSLFQTGCPERIEAEGDWSNAAFWLAARALGSDIDVNGLNQLSVQGDRAIQSLLPKLQENCTIACADIPDLVPVLSVVAAANRGGTFTDIARLRLKESDRVASVIAMIQALGGKAEATEHNLTVYGTGLAGGKVESFSDHRIAMAAAIASTICTQPVTISDAGCVAKSYPNFWEEYVKLGGKYEKLR